VTNRARDRWAEWLLERRFGGDAGGREDFLEGLLPWRDRVLANAGVGEGDVLLDVGAGDGLIAFGALEFVGESGRVIFSDVSQDLLDHSSVLAEEMNVLDRCAFVRAAADDLSEIEDASVDAVTTRSVLIYVKDKRGALREFHRVLKPGGRVSVFEPINRFRQPQPPHLFFGYDVTPVQEPAQKVMGVYRRLQPMDSDPMLDFDERDLLDFAEDAGFAEIELSYEAKISIKGSFHGVSDWGTFLRSAGNPNIPTMEEAMTEALTAGEIESLTAHLRPLVEGGPRKHASALAFVRAVK
jgi:ubiquinone/menaquinone biosynthesis C-methylase UbiE